MIPRAWRPRNPRNPCYPWEWIPADSTDYAEDRRAATKGVPALGLARSYRLVLLDILLLQTKLLWRMKHEHLHPDVGGYFRLRSL